MINNRPNEKDMERLFTMLENGTVAIQRFSSHYESNRGDGSREITEETDWYLIGPHEMDSDCKFPDNIKTNTLEEVLAESKLEKNDVVAALLQGRSVSGRTSFKYDPTAATSEKVKLETVYQLSDNKWIMVNMKEWQKRYESIDRQKKQREAELSQDCIDGIKESLSKLAGGYTNSRTRGLEMEMKHPDKGMKESRNVILDGFMLQEGMLFVTWWNKDQDIENEKPNVSIAERLGPESLREAYTLVTKRKNLKKQKQ